MLTDKSIRYIIRQLEKGRGTKVVAEEMKVSRRHVQRLWAEYLKTGTAHTRAEWDGPREPIPRMPRWRWYWTPTAAGRTGCS